MSALVRWQLVIHAATPPKGGRPSLQGFGLDALAHCIRDLVAEVEAAQASLRSTGDSALRITTKLGAAMNDADAQRARAAAAEAIVAAAVEYIAADEACGGGMAADDYSDAVRLIDARNALVALLPKETR